MLPSSSLCRQERHFSVLVRVHYYYYYLFQFVYLRTDTFHSILMLNAKTKERRKKNEHHFHFLPKCYCLRCALTVLLLSFGVFDKFMLINCTYDIKYDEVTIKSEIDSNKKGEYKYVSVCVLCLALWHTCWQILLTFYKNNVHKCTHTNAFHWHQVHSPQLNDDLKTVDCWIWTWLVAETGLINNILCILLLFFRVSFVRVKFEKKRLLFA